MMLKIAKYFVTLETGQFKVKVEKHIYIIPAKHSHLQVQL